MKKPTIERAVSDGIQKLYFFENGYGASVIRHSGSYGYESGLWELAVIKGSEKDWGLDFDTPITDGVTGYLNDEDVEELLEKIEGLEVANETNKL